MVTLKDTQFELEHAIAQLGHICFEMSKKLSSLDKEPEGIRDFLVDIADVEQQLKAAAFDVVVARRGEKKD